MKKLLFYTFFLALISANAIAQGPPPPPGDPDDVPIDGGLTWLLASGIGYGVYQFQKRKDEKKDLS